MSSYFYLNIEKQSDDQVVIAFSLVPFLWTFIADDIQLIDCLLRSLTKRVDKLRQKLLFPKILLFVIKVFLIFTFERDFKMRMAPSIRLRCLFDLSNIIIIILYVALVGDGIWSYVANTT